VANTITWAAYGTFTTAIAGASSAPTLKNLAAAGQKIGNAIDNTSAKNVVLDWRLNVRFASSPAAGAYVELYLILALDSSVYADGDDTVAPPRSALVGTFPCRLVSTAQVIDLPRIVVPPGLFKPLIINKGSTGFTNTDNENVLSYVAYELQVN
jgi:hypothetical protein